LLQFGVLAQAAGWPELLVPRDTPGLMDALAERGWLSGSAAASLRDAHAALLEAGLACTLDRRPRLTAPTPAIAQARAAISDAAREKELVFAQGR